MEEAVHPDDEFVAPPRRWRIWPLFLFASLILTGLLAFAWWQRTNLAGRLVQDQLDKYGVQASYEIEEIGLRTQRLKNIVLGDPANPDLVAKSIEVDVSLKFSGADIQAIRARGVQVNGRYADGFFSFGELDKFRDPKDKKPFELPAYAIDVADGRLRFSTPWGLVGAGFSGGGNLRGRFAGDFAAISSRLTYDDCTGTSVRFDGRLSLDDFAPTLDGPLEAKNVSCLRQGLKLLDPRIAGNFRLSKDYRNWLGKGEFSVAKFTSGANFLHRAGGTLEFDGDANRTNFNARLAQAKLESDVLRTRQLTLDAQGNVTTIRGDMAVAARGAAALSGGELSKSLLVQVDGLTEKGQDTPLGPMLLRLGNGIKGAGRYFDADMRYDFALGRAGRSVLTLDGVQMAARSGANIRQNGALKLVQGRSGWELRSPLNLEVFGGDLPRSRIALSKTATGWQGDIGFDAYSAGGLDLSNARILVSTAGAGRFSGNARYQGLDIRNVNLASNSAGIGQFSGNARYSGPIPGGKIAGFVMPLDASFGGGGLRMAGGCQRVVFDRLVYSDYSFGPQNRIVCPVGNKSIFAYSGGGVQMGGRIANLDTEMVYAGRKIRIASPDANISINKGFAASFQSFRASGLLGKSPYSVATPQLRFTTDDGFRARDVKVAMGPAISASKFDLATIDGRLVPGGLAGNVVGAAGQIGQIPLLMSEAGGTWTYRKSILQFDGRSNVADASAAPRFLPMTVPDIQLEMKNNIITAIGSIVEPKSGKLVGETDIRHELASGKGRSLLSVDKLRFDSAFGPELLTPLTKGVIANVEGSVYGDGRIEWDANGVRSTGRFGTDNMNLAAAFGQVDGLSSEIEFTDLLSLESRSSQLARIKSVNPGILALDGQIRYELLPGKRVQIEGGSWPFAGGTLLLEPTILDFDIEKPRRLTFRVEGLDAAKFLANYNFENLSVSGIFDGTLPMIFDSDGGRIIDGALVSRPGGGEMSYLGELTYADKGIYVDYVFNALRSVKYRQLVLTVNGDVDGEIITKVAFSGLQQGSLASRNFITKQLANVPIELNVSISAKFMQLIGSVRGLYDSNYVDNSRVPDLIEVEKRNAEAAKKVPPSDVNKDEQ